MQDRLIFDHFIQGIPAPAGSKRAFVIKGTGRAVVTDAGGEKTADWKRTVKHFVRDHFAGKSPETGPLELVMFFDMPRPKSHYRTGKNAGLLKADAPRNHTQKPDTTKLVRGVEDAMSGVVWRDDTQITKQRAEKNWTDHIPGVRIRVWRVEAAVTG
jgi:Holliday junction resolvase RusA-like endonuclease